MSRRYVVIGAGGVGAGLAAGFAEAGIPVLLVSRGRTFEAIRERGLVYRQAGVTRTLGVNVAGAPEQVALRPGDILVVATKSQDVPATLAAWAWRPVQGGGVAADLPIVLTHNGLVAERVALRYFSTVIGAVALVAARHVVSGEVEILNQPKIGQLIVGAYPSAALAPHAAVLAHEIAQDLSRANWLSQAVDEIQRWLAWKAVVSASFSVSVFDGTPQEQQTLREHLQAEARQALTAAGYGFADPAKETTYDTSLARIGQDGTTAVHRPSTWQSFERGAGSEVDYLNGEIVLLARLHGTGAPVNAAVQRVLGASASLGERPGAHTVAEVLALAGVQTGA
ncbi:ketopantoate reductase family protein [Xylophilus sp.]|uniref:ketopantoate reductase family protein n=1 Tax=Xylophilus sp. TaxID=2653893 RepID=UPI0013BAE367|nr:2-dehydropantoate 2-reductase N-terminal domain-containing protein [Xylophilus sp.]KAF1042890.1 MAG: hypothetical protein GAK38_04171 [Xylophilus sp.]